MSFESETIQADRPDGYWIEAFPFKVGDTIPFLIGYGLGTNDSPSNIEMFQNPWNSNYPNVEGAWNKRTLATLEFPVGCSYADVSGNGFNDLIISDKYGSSMNDIWPDGGRVSWLQNDGSLDTAAWPRRYIGKSPGMHRLKTGYFTRKDRIQIIAVPIVIASEDLTSPAPIIIYTAPENPLDAPIDDDTEGWETEVPFPDTFVLIHEVTVVPVSGGCDSVLLAGRDGINTIWFNELEQRWIVAKVNDGLPQEGDNPYWGSGSSALGLIGPYTGFVGSAEGFHGNIVAVYTLPYSKLPIQMELLRPGVKWTRKVLDDFGALNEAHTGSIHHVVCADIDGDGKDELLVALMGSDPPDQRRTGVWCYKPIDLLEGKWDKFQLSFDSAGRIAVGDMRGLGVVDVATISYSVPGYFESPNPSINLYKNPAARIPVKSEQVETPITIQKLNDEVLFRIPDPASATAVDEVEFLDVSARKLALVVVPPNSIFEVKDGEGLKVILGRVHWTDSEGVVQLRAQAAAPFTAVSTEVHAQDELVRTDASGAAFLLMRKSTTSGTPPYSDMSQLAAYNIFPERAPADVRAMTFPWVKVQDRPWANGRFKDLEFYNLVGFHVRQADDSDKVICHIQMWTAGVNVSAGFHNHVEASFCEIHACIVNGTGQGGMSWATVPDADFNPADPDPAQYDSIVVGDMHEHGPLWRSGEDGIPEFRKNGTVDYPWHAWIAGAADPANQAFDVWLAFEFPPLVSKVPRENASLLAPGLYRIVNPMLLSAVEVREGDSTDGTPIVPARQNPGRQQQWQVTFNPETEHYSFQNVASGSFAQTNWPPASSQTLVGSRSPAVLGITSTWTVTTNGDGFYTVWLIGTSLVWTLDQSNEITISEHVQNEGRQKWRFVNLGSRKINETACSE